MSESDRALNKEASGKDLASARMTGFNKSLGIEPIRAEEGESELGLLLRPEHLNSAQIVHGGVLASLLDCAAGAAIFSVLPSTEFAPTTTMSISYLSAVGEGTLIAKAKVQKKGRRMVYCESAVYSESLLLATAQLSFMVMKRDESFNADSWPVKN
ncbi:MAG: PaaI family thioesterase [Pseudomonadales bacterium]